MNLPAVIAGANVAKDMALCPKVAGISGDKPTEIKELDDVIAAISITNEHVYIRYYTAVLNYELRSRKGYIKGGMDRG